VRNKGCRQNEGLEGSAVPNNKAWCGAAVLVEGWEDTDLVCAGLDTEEVMVKVDDICLDEENKTEGSTGSV